MIRKHNLVEALAIYAMETDSTVATAVEAIAERFVEAIIEDVKTLEMTYEEVDCLNDAIAEAIESYSEEAEQLIKEWNEDAQEEYEEIEEARRGRY